MKHMLATFSRLLRYASSPSSVAIVGDWCDKQGPQRSCSNLRYPHGQTSIYVALRTYLLFMVSTKPHFLCWVLNCPSNTSCCTTLSASLNVWYHTQCLALFMMIPSNKTLSFREPCFTDKEM